MAIMSGQCTAAVATKVSTSRLYAAKRVNRPNTSRMAPPSSNQVAIAQLISAGILLNGNGNLSWISLNQLSPEYFSRPDSQNSQPMIRRRTSGGSNWPMPRRRVVSDSQTETAFSDMAWLSFFVRYKSFGRRGRDFLTTDKCIVPVVG